MGRLLALTGLLVLGLAACSSCSRHHPPAAPAAPATAGAPAAAPAPAQPISPPAPVQTAIEQATGAQESPDGNENEKPTSGDTSLERMTSLPADVQLPSGRWKPGVNYDPMVPAQPTAVEPGKVEVIEFMWLGCPHCYALEASIRQWLKSKPVWIEFVRVPVMWDVPHRAHAKLLYTLQALGHNDLVDKAFDTIQQQRNPLIASTDEESLRVEQAWAAQQGVSASDFASAFNSLLVNTSLHRAEDLTMRYRVSTVPMVAVNGKYLTDVAKAGNSDKLIELINDLAASEHRH